MEHFLKGRGLSYLGTSIGTGEQDTGRCSGKSTGGAGVAKGAETLDVAGHFLLTAEASFGKGQKGGNKDKLGLHVGRWGGLCVE